MKYIKIYESNINNFIALCFYDAGGTVKDVILFDNEKDRKNYIINYVNNSILDDYDEYELDIESYISKIEHIDNIIRDENNIPMFFDSENASIWYNDFNENNEDTFSLSDCKIEKNIKLDDRLSIALSTKKYNL